MIGLHVSVSSDGKIKRHLSTANGEVPLADVTIFDELIALIEGEVWLICAFVKSVLLETDVASDCKAGAAHLQEAVTQYLSGLRATNPVYAYLSEFLISDSI